MVVLDILKYMNVFHLTRGKEENVDSRRGGMYVYTYLVSFPIPPTWRDMWFREKKKDRKKRKKRRKKEERIMFPFPFPLVRSFVRSFARADSRRFSRADLILQGGFLLASCAADADGSEGFTDPPSDGVNDYSRTSCISPRDFDNHLLSRNCSQSNQPGSGYVTKARSSSLDGELFAAKEAISDARSLKWSIVVICCAKETIFQHQKSPPPGRVYLPARLTVI